MHNYHALLSATVVVKGSILNYVNFVWIGHAKQHLEPNRL